jgi:DNA-binding transcriptional ArsR family regulator
MEARKPARTTSRPTRRSREVAARGLREILYSRLFRALCEPVRAEILEFLTIHGRSDVASIADAFPQDRSVISRHLQILVDAGVLRREKEGRQVFLEMDGPAVVAQVEQILERFRTVVPMCCPARQS